jgi:hypothetical protein
MRTLAAGGGIMAICYAVYSGVGGGHSAEDSVVVHEPANIAYNAVAESLPASGVYPLPTDPSVPPAELHVESKSTDKIAVNLRIGSESLLRYQITFEPIDAEHSKIYAAMDVNDALFRQYFLAEKSIPAEVLPVAYKYALAQQLRDIGQRIDEGRPIPDMMFNRRNIALNADAAWMEAAAARLDHADRYQLRAAQRQATAPMIDARPKSVRPMMSARPTPTGYESEYRYR